MNFTFVPFGRYVWVSPPIQMIENPEETPKILLPENYTKDEEKYVVVKYYAMGPGCDGKTINSYIVGGDLTDAFLIVEKRMLEKIKALEFDSYVVLDQYVVGAYVLIADDENE